VSALLDTMHFIGRARSFTATTTSSAIPAGSICEVVDPDDPRDPVLTALSENLLLVWIRGTEAHTEELIRRFDRAPKPMYYQREFLARAWADYLAETGLAEDAVDPDAFVRWTYARASPTASRATPPWPRTGASPSRPKMAALHVPEDFDRLIGRALEAG
jgi:hypothetical protein